MLVCCAGCRPVVAPISGGGVAVGWYILLGCGCLVGLECCYAVFCKLWCHGLPICSLCSRLSPCNLLLCGLVHHIFSKSLLIGCLMSLVSCTGSCYDRVVSSCGSVCPGGWLYLCRCCISTVCYNLLLLLCWLQTGFLVLMLRLGLWIHWQLVHNDLHLWLGWLGCSGVRLGLCRSVLLADLI